MIAGAAAAIRAGSGDGHQGARIDAHRVGADLRLAAPAAAIWVGTLLGLHVGVRRAVGVATLAAGIAVLSLLRGSPRAAVIGIGAGSAAVALSMMAVRVHARNSSPLFGLAAARATVSAEAVVSSDPAPIASAPAAAHLVSVRLTLRTLSAGGRSWQLSGSVLVFASGADWSRLLPSQRIAVAGKAASADRSTLMVAVLSARGPPRLIGGPSATQRMAGRLRSGLRQAAGVLPTGARGLLPGLVDGDTSGMSQDLTADARTAGLTHLTAVSGANVAIVCGAVLLVCGAVGLGPRTSAAATAVALVGFVVLARPSPSVLRAAVMGGVALVALATGRSRAAMPALSASCGLLVLVEPQLASSVGFGMSVAATLALLLIAPAWTRVLVAHGVPVRIAQMLCVAAAAHLVSAPLIAAISGRVSLVAIPANMLVEPAVAPATVLGLLAAVSEPWSAHAGELFAWLAGWPVRWIVLVAHRAAGFPDAAVAWPSGARGAVLLAVGLYAIAVALRSALVRRLTLVPALAAIVVAIPVRAAAPGWPPAGWIFVACPVGEADAYLLNAGDGSGVLVDTGTDGRGLAACLSAAGVHRLRLVALTDYRPGHVGGIGVALRSAGVALMGPEPVGGSTGWQPVATAAAAHSLVIAHPARGREVPVGSWRLQIVDSGRGAVVLRAAGYGHTVLFAQSAGLTAQAALVGERADVLVVPDHGSASGTDPGFVAAVAPTVGVVSAPAGNRYGEPAASVSRALGQAPLWRTDSSIAVCTSGAGLRVLARSRGP